MIYFQVNEVVQKMSGSDRPVPVWSEFGEEGQQNAATAAAEQKEQGRYSKLS